MSGIYFKKGNSFSKVNIYKKTEDGIVLCPVYRKTSNGMERIDLNDGSNENINGVVVIVIHLLQEHLQIILMMIEEIGFIKDIILILIIWV